MESPVNNKNKYSFALVLTTSLFNCIHLVRMFRSFLEGFALLENHNAFGNTQLIKDSFELSINILVEGAKKLEGK